MSVKSPVIKLSSNFTHNSVYFEILQTRTKDPANF